MGVVSRSVRLFLLLALVGVFTDAAVAPSAGSKLLEQCWRPNMRHRSPAEFRDCAIRMLLSHRQRRGSFSFVSPLLRNLHHVRLQPEQPQNYGTGSSSAYGPSVMRFG
ncbi:hypothetical protein BOX15_Mlig020466g2 [Macrostomum lignano]|uniref:Secreted protein n=1 Tax=Macrostomum lignano TaxID=282301 RepID=A0A267H0Z0_9PLAT|nr:hypothetical protein BOX15_Mlig020466g2 [Macrostomum lignano]